jgi:D-alanyl-lipoteichoic acid acyltransferase DltB (MBOAT superfamily)
MLFNTLQYGVFFVVVFTLHWVMPQQWRRPFLLVASYYFYASAIPKYLLLILGLTAFNYGMGRWMGATQEQCRRRTILVLTIVGNLGSLAYFKYTDFILTSVAPLLKPLPLLSPLVFNDPLLQNILLPLGISFFTFEFIHYIAELYKGREPIKNPVDFALFAAFFPTQIAGPIKRFPDFMKQLAHPLTFREVDIDGAIGLILRGLLKKVLVADTLSPVVGALFAHPDRLGPLSAAFAVLAFTTQIYCDFSGYTDIGRGSALLLGYNVPINFNSPYQSAKVGDFWNRWHISLSTWLRDYLFIPLGGSRVKPAARIYLNLMITMALGGCGTARRGTSWCGVLTRARFSA